MLNKQEKIDFINNKLDNLEKMKKSYYDNSKNVVEKYGIPIIEYINRCETQIQFLLQELENITNSWVNNKNVIIG